MSDRWQAVRGYVRACLVASVALAGPAGAEDWPPELNGDEGETAALRSEAFLKLPASVAEARGRAGSATFPVRHRTRAAEGAGVPDRAIEQACDDLPGGTYGIKLSADGGTRSVNFNGHASDRIRPATMRPNGFGLCAFAAIHLPASER